MQFQAINIERETEQISLRVFKDQLDSMHWLCKVKYRGRYNRSDLIRAYMDQGIERDTGNLNGA